MQRLQEPPHVKRHQRFPHPRVVLPRSVKELKRCLAVDVVQRVAEAFLQFLRGWNGRALPVQTGSAGLPPVVEHDLGIAQHQQDLPVSRLTQRPQ